MFGPRGADASGFALGGFDTVRCVGMSPPAQVCGHQTFRRTPTLGVGPEGAVTGSSPVQSAGPRVRPPEPTMWNRIRPPEPTTWENVRPPEPTTWKNVRPPEPTSAQTPAPALRAGRGGSKRATSLPYARSGRHPDALEQLAEYPLCLDPSTATAPRTCAGEAHAV